MYVYPPSVRLLRGLGVTLCGMYAISGFKVGLACGFAWPLTRCVLWTLFDGLCKVGWRTVMRITSTTSYWTPIFPSVRLLRGRGHAGWYVRFWA